MGLTMPRPARVFVHGEAPVCSRCAKPEFVLVGVLLRCNNRNGPDRTRCGAYHYSMHDNRGNTVLAYLTREEADEVRDSDLPTAVLSRLQLPQMAQEMLSGLQRAA